MICVRYKCSRIVSSSHICMHEICDVKYKGTVTVIIPHWMRDVFKTLRTMFYLN